MFWIRDWSKARRLVFRSLLPWHWVGTGWFLVLYFSALPSDLLLHIHFLWSFHLSCVHRTCGLCGVILVCLVKLFKHWSCPLRNRAGFSWCSVTSVTLWKAGKLFRAEANDTKKACMYLLDYTINASSGKLEEQKATPPCSTPFGWGAWSAQVERILSSFKLNKYLINLISASRSKCTCYGVICVSDYHAFSPWIMF